MTKKRTQAERRGTSDRNLVEGAISVIASRGVTAATFEAIGKEAGYSKGLATQRFGSKEGLINAVIDFLSAEYLADLDHAGVRDKDGYERLILTMNLIVDFIVEKKNRRAYYMLLAAGVADLLPHTASFASSHSRALMGLIALIARGQEDGSIRKELDPVSAAHMVGALALGTAFALLADRNADLSRIRQGILVSLERTFKVDEGL
ncbi:TetR/AcrR family transcriptional regulator [soil metagenome]